MPPSVEEASPYPGFFLCVFFFVTVRTGPSRSSWKPRSLPPPFPVDHHHHAQANGRVGCVRGSLHLGRKRDGSSLPTPIPAYGCKKRVLLPHQSGVEDTWSSSPWYSRMHLNGATLSGKITLLRIVTGMFGVVGCAPLLLGIALAYNICETRPNHLQIDGSRLYTYQVHSKSKFSGKYDVDSHGIFHGKCDTSIRRDCLTLQIMCWTFED